jgi:hypothetical protein
MADELQDIINDEDDTDTDPETPEGDKGHTGKRIKSLLNKTKDAYRERDEEKTKREAAEQRVAEMEFTHGFEKMTSTYPFAKDHQEEIKKLVSDNRLSVEDATTLVLKKNDKLVTAEQIKSQEEANRNSGGSIPTALPPGGSKKPEDMTQDERIAALKEAEDKGDLSLS